MGYQDYTISHVLHKQLRHATSPTIPLFFFITEEFDEKWPTKICPDCADVEQRMFYECDTCRKSDMPGNVPDESLFHKLVGFPQHPTPTRLVFGAVTHETSKDNEHAATDGKQLPIAVCNIEENADDSLLASGAHTGGRGTAESPQNPMRSRKNCKVG